MGSDGTYDATWFTLTRAFVADPEAVKKLFEFRVPCNQQLADDPMVIVNDEGDGTFTVGLLGIINGIITDIQLRNKCDVELVASVYSDDNQLLGFSKYISDTKGFENAATIAPAAGD